MILISAPMDLKKIVHQTVERARASTRIRKTQSGGPRVLLKTYMRHVSRVAGDPAAIEEALMGVIENAIGCLAIGREYLPHH